MFDLVQTLKEPHVAINGAISRNGVPRRTGVDRRTTRHQGGRSHIFSAAQPGGSLRDLARDHPEIAVRYRARIPVKHDAIFVDGCFWHGCPVHGCIPKTNRDFWQSKLDKNKQRDRLVVRELKRRGWKPLRVWQHELRRPSPLWRGWNEL